ncbi:hypothetical protein CS022_07445 [Veronia nyctiphanis]|uniref:OmpA-like domain-containing protein n=2 Tax=Veronia nyctiphanis TaxID=1278244 RepID=A0A4Q0YRU0_9GAMM|nr:hypothetical protein CS022_07445 [Veronia nyctiphanis]
MKIALLVFPILAGCSSTQFVSTDIVTMADQVQQVKDLRDRDDDGVIEARERCDRTLVGAIVDNDGCPSSESSKMTQRLDVKFANNSDILLPGSTVSIKKLADFLKAYPKAEIIVEGHASKVGDPAKNLILSENRAKRVANTLTQVFGIDADRVGAVGFGDTQPLVSGDSESAHSKNRRVMAAVSGESINVVMRWTIFTDEQ